MKIPSVIPLGLAVLAPAAFGQTLFHQSFNNDNAGFTDSFATEYNWNVAAGSAADVNPSYISPATGNVSAGNTDPSPLFDGEAFRGRGFLFGTVTDGSTPGAYVKYTTHSGVSTDLQNDPQPDWYRIGPAMSFEGLTLGQITDLTVRSNVRTSAGVDGIEARFGLRVNGDWYFSADAINLETSWGDYSLADPASQQWISGAFAPGVSLDIDLDSPSFVTLDGNDVVEGYAWAYWIGDLTGNDAWARLDRYVVTAIPEPSAYAALIGALALGLVLWRRRRN
ncbi:MAG: PEP-CTERM sorting domain-containing protein [Opitutales bacterium]|nr:PEP-CTERM sorting domain-containing protein [Opitutales bacterium]